MTRQRFSGWLFGLFAVALSASDLVQAQQIYIVDRLTDVGEGEGLTGDLRYCMTQAISADTIIFNVSGTINLTGALPDLSASIAISGPGADVLTIRRQSRGEYRIFTVGEAAISRISGLTLADGGEPLEGGGILNRGTLTVDGTSLAANRAERGGGIFNAGTLTVRNSTLFGNYGKFGGGIFNVGTLTVTNTTISGNTFGLTGGGIHNSGTLAVASSTISTNYEIAFLTLGGGIFNENQTTLEMRNTILAANVAGSYLDLRGRLTSSGYNLIGSTSGGSGFDEETDLLNVDPMLGPLQDNGGPTFTHALLPGSPAIDAGDNTDAPDFDQRGKGFPRIVNGIIDIGAFEVQKAQ